MNKPFFENTLQFAKRLDKQDPLQKYRKQFFFPKHKKQEVIYFTGNSLGLQPKNTSKHINAVLKDWARFAVEGHFEGTDPWLSYHEQLAKPLARLTGAKTKEVVAMNHLTGNLHFLFVSFYRPTKSRYKILCEAKAFPSDQYLIDSQVKFHGYNPADAVIEVAPRKGEYILRHEDIIAAIEQHKNELALVFIGGVNYYSGQVFDMRAITAAGHAAGALVGFDLAHAIGNVKLNLNQWNVDFAAWCSYKYLNSGPGNIGGAFIHQRHHRAALPRFAGWWGHDKKNRFKMEKAFSPIPSAEGWQLSTNNTIGLSAHKAALAIIDEAGIDAMLQKSKKLTAYLEFIIDCVNEQQQEKNKKIKLEIITPKNARGCQLSIVAHGLGKDFFNQLVANGVLPDWREPNVIRLAPVPLYNSFEDVYRFGEIVSRLLK